MGKIVIVTGGTSGIGLHTAAYLQSQGCTVYTVSRRACDDARFHHICADVTQEVDVARAVKTVLDEAGALISWSIMPGSASPARWSLRTLPQPGGSWMSISGAWPL